MITCIHYTIGSTEQNPADGYTGESTVEYTSRSTDGKPVPSFKRYASVDAAESAAMVAAEEHGQGIARIWAHDSEY